MTEITTAMVKELRDKTGAGMMDCKKALTETSGDQEKAVDWLRKSGLMKAGKKEGRVAADGLIGVAADGRSGALVEVNSETDFVARNATFQEMVRTIADLAHKAGGDLGKLTAAKWPGTSLSVADQIKEAVATIGENMTLRRTGGLKVGEGVLASYVHNAAGPGLGKIGVLVAMDSKGDKAKLEALGRQIAMHIAAASPQAASADELDPALIERERAIYTEQAQSSGKSAEIIAKMVDGRMKKEFFQQVVLTEQKFVMDESQTVAAVLKAAEKDVGAPVKVSGFLRYKLGEGVEKRKEDFAAEVAAMTKKS